MKRRKTNFYCAGPACAMLLATTAAADLVVLYDSGQSWPIDDYLQPIAASRAAEARTGQSRPNPALGPEDPRVLLPLRSPSLSPGPVATRPFETPTAVAFFMVGCDERSLRWLIKHRDRLKQQGAVGLLVDAGDENDLLAVANAANGLPITPASGEDIASALAITHYPLAVTEGHIWQ